MSDPEVSITFDALSLRSEVRAALRDMNFQTPTPVQLQSYAPIVEGRDLIVQAQTGTGKTAAFGIPLIDRRLDDTPEPQALILAPTRELALQSAKELERIAKHTSLRTLAVYGGAHMQQQINALQQGVQIVSGTPGRVLDHLIRGTLNLSKLKVLVLDEADEMLSMGFIQELQEIIARLPKARQTLLFSATVEDDVRRISDSYLVDPVLLSLSSDAVGAAGICHYVYLVSGRNRSADLKAILEVENPETALIFCNTKAQTEAVVNDLRLAGMEADWLNGDLPQRDREAVLARTRTGKLRYLVATDVAARGIDISHITHVINYTFPDSAEQYVHRTGRTGRAGRTGTALSLVGPSEIGSLYYLRLQYKIHPIERSLPTDREFRSQQEVEQLTKLNASMGVIDPRAHGVARRILERADHEQIVAGLVSRLLDMPLAVAASAKSPVATTAKPESSQAAASRDTGSRRRSRTRRNRVTAELGKPEATTTDATDGMLLYVSLGRKDGFAAEDVIRLVEERCALAKEQIRQVRVRELYSFMNVPTALAQAVIDALNGQQVGAKKVVVELARSL